MSTLIYTSKPMTQSPANVSRCCRKREQCPTSLLAHHCSTVTEAAGGRRPCKARLKGPAKLAESIRILDSSSQITQLSCGTFTLCRAECKSYSASVRSFRALCKTLTQCECSTNLVILSKPGHSQLLLQPVHCHNQCTAKVTA